MYLNGREAHLRFVPASQRHQVLHVLHKLVWVIGFMHWSHLCRAQRKEMLDSKQLLMTTVDLLEC